MRHQSSANYHRARSTISLNRDDKLITCGLVLVTSAQAASHKPRRVKPEPSESAFPPNQPAPRSRCAPRPSCRLANNMQRAPPCRPACSAAERNRPTRMQEKRVRFGSGFHLNALRVVKVFVNVELAGESRAWKRLQSSSCVCLPACRAGSVTVAGFGVA